MGIQELIAVIESGIAVAVILVLMLKLWPSLRVDEFRQSMFAIRDELFDFALSGAISFDHPAYRLLRESMNGFIRYGHQLTLFRLVCNFIRWNLHDERVFSWASKWDAALKGIDDDNLKQALRQFQSRAFTLVLKRLIAGSVVLIFLLAVMMLYEMLKTQWVSLRQLARISAQLIVTRMFDPRFLEEEAYRA